jgi:hypothetical protein
MTRIYLSVSLLAITLLLTGCPRQQPPEYQTRAGDIERISGAVGGASAEAAVKEVANPTGWATLRGKFTMSGPVALPPISVTKDQQICGNTAPNPAVQLGPNNEVQFVLIYIDKLPALEDPWVHPDYTATANDEVEFDQKKCIVLSHVLGMRSTQKLKVLNSDTVGHNTSIKAFGFDTIIAAGSSSIVDSVKAIKEPAGTSCAIHPWMSAYIMATPHPYIAVTDEKGEFEIKNIPAGVDLEFRIWQEQVKYVPGGTVGGAPVTWPKGRMKAKFENDETRVMEVVLDAAKFQ